MDGRRFLFSVVFILIFSHIRHLFVLENNKFFIYTDTIIAIVYHEQTETSTQIRVLPPIYFCVLTVKLLFRFFTAGCAYCGHAHMCTNNMRIEYIQYTCASVSKQNCDSCAQNLLSFFFSLSTGYYCSQWPWIGVFFSFPSCKERNRIFGIFRLVYECMHVWVYIGSYIDSFALLFRECGGEKNKRQFQQHFILSL